MPPFGSFDSIFIAIGVYVCGFAVLKYVVYPLWVLWDEGPPDTPFWRKYWYEAEAPKCAKHAPTLGRIIGGLAAVLFVGWGAFLMPVGIVMGLLASVGVESQMALVFAIVIVAGWWLRFWIRRKQ